jgi:hypothetical protein
MKPKALVRGFRLEELGGPVVAARTVQSLDVLGVLLLPRPRRVHVLLGRVLEGLLEQGLEDLPDERDDAEVEVQLADESEQHCLAFLREGLVLIKRRVNTARQNLKALVKGLLGLNY